MIIRSNRRTVALEFTEEGFLRVRGPLWFTDKDAEKFVQKNEPWIRAHQPAAAERYRRLQAFSAEDIEKLMQLIVQDYIPLSCPHGRPILIKLTKRELEVRFKRIQ